jgi:hypothetical protein
MKIRTYSELAAISSFEDRYEYLALGGSVGVKTFGYDRWINQKFYTSRQWKDLRNHIIVRDQGCDLGVLGFEIHDRIYIHHMNPMTVDSLVHGEEEILDPEFLIATSHRTHNAIHYGDKNLLPREYTPRKLNDTKLW